MRPTSPLLACACLALTPAVAGLVAPTPASAANRIYWTNAPSDGTVEGANLDGSGSNLQITTTGASALVNPLGVAIDPAHNRIYWANTDGGPGGLGTISEANLDGSGSGTDLKTTGATVHHPAGVAIDPAHNRIYWANTDGGPGGLGTISEANLDGSGSGTDLKTTGATVDAPEGIAIDPAANEIVWSNDIVEPASISEANLDGSGSGHTLYSDASIDFPAGVAIDVATGKLYWADHGGNEIGVGKLSGAGSPAILDTTGATTAAATGVAIDPAHNRIYWFSSSFGRLGEANLDGTGAASNVSLPGAVLSEPGFPALLEPPAPSGAPVITGTATVGSMLTCSQGGWGGDLLGGFLFQAPRSFAYTWQIGGTVLAGATQPTVTASASGPYTCQVTATNAAGSASQASAAFAVAAPVPIAAPPGAAPVIGTPPVAPPPAVKPSNRFSIRFRPDPKTGIVAVRIVTRAAGELRIVATFPPPRRRGGRTRSRTEIFGRATARTTAAKLTAATVIRPSRSATARLRAAHRLRIGVTVRFTPTAGAARTGAFTVVVVLRPRRRRAR